MNYFLNEILNHYLLRKDEVFYDFLTVNEFDDVKNKLNDRNNDQKCNKFADYHEIYEYASAYIQNTINNSLNKNGISVYDTTEIDVIFKRINLIEECLIKLNEYFFRFNKIKENETDIQKALSLEFNFDENTTIFDGILSWQNYLDYKLQKSISVTNKLILFKIFRNKILIFTYKI